MAIKEVNSIRPLEKEVKNLKQERETTINNLKNVVLEKFNTKENLIGFNNLEYEDFLKKSLKQYLFRKKYYLNSFYNKKLKRNLDYYLYFRKYHLTPEYKIVSSKKQIMTSEMATTKNESRNLNLYVNLEILSHDPETGEETVLNRTNNALLFGKVPLLVNSVYDVHADNTFMAPYYFIINGASKYLSSLLISNPGVMKIKNLRSSEDSTEMGTVARLNENPSTHRKPVRLNYDPLKKTYSVYMYNLRQEVNLFYVLRLLGAKISQIISYSAPYVSEVEALSFLIDPYKQTKAEVISSLYKSFTGVKADTSELTQGEKADFVHMHLQKFLCYDSTTENKEQWEATKKTQLLHFYRDLLRANRKNEFFEDSLSYKKAFTLKDHLKKGFKLGFEAFLERAKSLILREINIIQKSKSVSIFTAVDTLKKSYQQYFLRGDTKSHEPYSDYISYMNHTSLISGQRKVTSLLNKDVLYQQLRAMSPSKYGRVCPVQTPHSKSVGLVDYLAIGCKFSRDCFDEVYALLNTFRLSNDEGTKVFLDSRYYKNCTEPIDTLISKLMKMKRKYDLSLSYSKDENTLYIRTINGRFLKPFYTLVKGIPIILKYTPEILKEKSLETLVQEKAITYLDPQQQMDATIVENFSTTNKDAEYMIIDYALYLGYAVSLLPLLSLNMGHRASLASRLMDQSLGSKLTKPRFMYKETNVQYLIDANVSLVATKMENSVKEVIGQNVIMGYGHGNVQEDALEFNRSAAQRGLFKSMVIKKVGALSAFNGKEYSFQGGSNEQESAQGAVTNVLDQDGLPLLNSTCNESIVLALKQSGEKYTNTISPITEFYVENVYYKCTIEEADIKIYFSKLRSLKVGDKLGTRNGIKGVISENIPEYYRGIPCNGVNPALWISTHVVNSRMAIGPLAEVLLSKASAISGKQLEITPFIHGGALQKKIHQAESVLKNQDYAPTGKDDYFDVQSKRKLSLYIGPSKILYLQHHGRDKQYQRTDKGGLDPLTRQPGAGRKVKGGIRFGQMQCNSAIEHAAVNFLNDKLNIDKVKVPVCNCGDLLDYSKEGIYCNFCKEDTLYSIVEVPYSFLVFSKILRSCNINTKIDLKKAVGEIDKLPGVPEIPDLGSDLEDKDEL